MTDKNLAPMLIFGAPHDHLYLQDITLKLPGRKPLRTAIKEHAAWKLKQVHLTIVYCTCIKLCVDVDVYWEVYTGSTKSIVKWLSTKISHFTCVHELNGELM